MKVREVRPTQENIVMVKKLMTPDEDNFSL